MKKTIAAVLLSVALVGLLTPSAHAISAYGIWWMPDSSDDDGWGVGIKDKRHFTPLVAIDGRLSYVSFSTPDASMFPVEATAMITLGLWYGGIGAGYYITTGDIDSEFGWYALLGLELGLGPASVFGEVKWQDLKPDLDVPGGGDADLDALVLHVGATFSRPLK